MARILLPLRRIDKVNNMSLTGSVNVTLDTLNERGLPLVVSPADGFADIAMDELIAWLQENRENFRPFMHRHGALLFRGFKTLKDAGAPGFERFIDALTEDVMDYRGGITPRQSVHGKVVTATDIPPEQRIGPHQEMSYHSHPPRHIAFFCDLEPTEGGQTPLTDMRSVYQRVNPQVRDRFESKGVRTIRRLPGKKRYAPSKVFLNRTWQEVLLVSDKKGAERVIKEWGWQGRWVGDDDLIIRQNPGVGTTVHPDTRDPVWFNQAPTQHRRLLTWQPFQAGFYKAWLMAKLDQWLHPERPRVHMEHNDGSPLRMSDLDHVKKILEEETVMFDWCKGDTLLVDNILTGHGRMPYKGPRRIYVALLDRFKI